MLFAASVITAAFKKQRQELKENESGKVDKKGVTGERKNVEKKAEGKKKAEKKDEEAALKKHKEENVADKKKAAKEEEGAVGGGQMSQIPTEKESVAPSNSFQNLIEVDDNFLTMCREIEWSTNVSRDTLTALQLSLNDFVGRE